jgi:hypothetical protein
LYFGGKNRAVPPIWVSQAHFFEKKLGQPPNQVVNGH